MYSIFLSVTFLNWLQFLARWCVLHAAGVGPVRRGRRQRRLPPAVGDAADGRAQAEQALEKGDDSGGCRREMMKEPKVGRRREATGSDGRISAVCVRKRRTFLYFGGCAVLFLSPFASA